MKSKATILWLTIFGLLGLVAGCGKTESPAPSSGGAEKAVKSEQVAPAPPVEKPVEQATNRVAATADAAKTAVETTAKAADTAVAPPKETAPAIVSRPSPTTSNSQDLTSQGTSGLASLSQDQVVQGLKDALGKGLQQAVAGLGRDGGFLTNLDVKIPMPEKLQKVETGLRAINQQKLADDFVATMNHAAEQAVPEAAGVFADALKGMTIEDAKSILAGPNDAATQYFQKATQTNLYAKFQPIVQKATEKTGVTAAYKKVMAKANIGQSLGSLGSALGGSVLDKDSMDIDAYVTNKALDGLFKMVAAEEARIRQNPVARTTDMLQKVFGALKK